MPKINIETQNYIVRLQRAIRQTSGCGSKYLETVTVSQSFPGFHDKNVSNFEVAVFELYEHPKASRAYSWYCTCGDKATRYVVVLQIPPVVSPETAVQAAIAAQLLKASLLTRS